MSRLSRIALPCILAAIFLLPVVVRADEDRDRIIEKELECISRSHEHANVAWADVCYKYEEEPKPRGAGREELIAQELNRAGRYSKEDDEPLDPQQSPAIFKSENIDEEIENNKTEIFEDPDFRSSLKPVELSFQIGSYNYHTDANWPYYYSDTHTSSNEVEKTGALFGLAAAYTYRKPYEGVVHSWKDLKNEAGMPFFSFARVEANLSIGEVSYDSSTTGKLKGYDALQGESRILAGYDFLSKDLTFMVTPYIGVGYRYFTDESGGWVDFVGNRHYPYKYIHQTLYLPVGIETLKKVNDNWDFGFKFEGDIMIWGYAKFNQSDVPGLFPAIDASTGLPITVSLEDSPSLDFNRGFGAKTSFKLIKKLHPYNIFVEPYLEFWRFGRSDDESANATGTNGTLYYSVTKVLYEPPSYTLGYGLRLGVQF